MEEELIKARLASLFLLLQYQKLIELSLGNMDKSDTYMKCIDKTKEYFQIESEIYDSFDKSFIIDCFNHANVGAVNTVVDMRLFSKISERALLYLGTSVDGDTIIPSLIIAKKNIDAAKEVKTKIDSLRDNKKLSANDLYELKTLAKIDMFMFFIDNSYIEKIALDHNFILDDIPRIDLNEYILKYGNNFDEKIQPLLFLNIIESIEALTDITNIKDRIKIMFNSLNDYAYINSLLPYLDREHLDSLWNEFVNNSTKLDRNAALRKVRKLIEKRKEEFMK